MHNQSAVGCVCCWKRSEVAKSVLRTLDGYARPFVVADVVMNLYSSQSILGLNRLGGEAVERPYLFIHTPHHHVGTQSWNMAIRLRSDH